MKEIETHLKPTHNYDDYIDITPQQFGQIVSKHDINCIRDDLFYSCLCPQEAVVVIDVRNPDEIQECPETKELSQMSEVRWVNIPSSKAEHLNITSLERDYNVKRNQTLLVVCRSGNRSLGTQKRLAALGYDAFSVFGGMKAMKSSLYKVLKR